jgi:ATP phosphoribosyltransferase
MMTMALPKGRLFDKTSELLARCGYNLSLGERQLVARENRVGFRRFS